ncbi:MAG: ribonuclease E/G [Coprococcus sp.]
MKKQIVITGWQSQILTALYENELLCELWLEPEKDQVRIGDIYIGKVKHIVPNIQAAFVEIQPGIMGYYSLNSNKNHLFVNSKKNDKLVAGDEIVVQVEKENLKTKAWTLTGQLSFPGRYTVLNAEPHKILISSRIKSFNERERLRSIIADSSYTDTGWMIRTEAEDMSADIIYGEMAALLVNYNHIMSIYRSRTCFSKLWSGDTIYEQTIRQARRSGSCVVTTDCETIYRKISDTFAADKSETSSLTLKYYDDPSYSLIKLKGIEAQIEKAIQKKVWLKSGAYLVIEPTEALTVIDVNTGKAVGKQNMEENFFRINMEAAREVCRQLRLRNISGIVIVDFINMKNQDHLRQLMECLKEEASKDAVQTTIVDRTALHLVEITRKKVHRSLFEQVYRLI